MSQKKLTHRQKRAITALLEKPTIGEAASLTGVNPRTIYRWFGSPEFRAGLAAAEGDLIDQATRRLVALGNKAVDALADILANPAQRGASNKRLAAVAVLDNLLKLRELRTIETRLEELEKAVYYEKRG
jgi:AcrR family transcriptional regulator